MSLPRGDLIRHLGDVFFYSRFTILDLLGRGATGICQRICKAHVFDKTFGVKSALQRGARHVTTCGRDEARSVRSGVVIGLRVAEVSTTNFWLDSALKNRTIAS